MTNKEIQDMLQQVLKSSDTPDSETAALLMDATIHVIKKAGLPLQGSIMTYGLMVAGHEVLWDLLGEDVLELPDASSLPASLLLKEATSSKPAMAPDEEEKVNKLLKDINFDSI